MNWTIDKTKALFKKPLLDLLYEAQRVHRQHFDPQEIQMSTLLSVKTGDARKTANIVRKAPDIRRDCGTEKLLEVERVLQSARQAKEAGSSRFCMGAAWSNPHERDMPYLEEMVKGVKALGLETCMTLGKLTDSQAERLAGAGLDYYSHNLDTSPEYYGSIITTRTYQDRLTTIEKVRAAGIKVCSGGILGLGERDADRIGPAGAIG